MAQNYFLKPHKHPIIIAHRGASGDAPENTMASFHLALQQQADAIELDVQRSRDGRLVIMHDALLGRSNNGHGLVGRKSLRELHQLDAGSWFSPKFAKEPIPTLGEVLDTFGDQTHYVIELKYYQGDKVGFAHQVYEMVAQRGLLPRTMFLSFSARLLNAIKARDESAVTCLALAPYLEMLHQHASHRHDVVAFSFGRSHSHLFKEYRLPGISKPINAWWGHAAKLDRLAHAHVPMMTTNYPAKLHKLLTQAN